MNIDINYLTKTVLQNLKRGIKEDYNRTGDVTRKEEEEILKKYGIKPEDYKKAMEKVGAETPSERTVVMAELEKLLERIKELAPDDFQTILSELFAQAVNVNSIEDLFKVFSDKINELEVSDARSQDEKDIEKLLFKNMNYAEQMTPTDLEAVVSILQSHGNDWKVQAFKNGNQTTITFKIGSKDYQFTTNQDVVISSLSKTQQALPATSENITKFENILKDFIEGKLPWYKLAEELEPFGINSNDLHKNTNYKDNGDTYVITVTYGGKTYVAQCNLVGANDGDIDSKNYGDTYTVFSKQDLNGFTEEEIAKYFTSAMKKGDETIYYAKNEDAWKEAGATDIENLRQIIHKQETRGVSGTDGTNGADGTNGPDTSTVTEIPSQLASTVTDVCNKVAKDVGLNGSEIDRLLSYVNNDILLLLSETPYVGYEAGYEGIIPVIALGYAADIINDRTKEPEDVDIDTMLKNIENHNSDGLTQLKAAYDKGLVDVEIKKSLSSGDYTVSIIDTNGKVLKEEEYSKSALEQAGFNLKYDSKRNIIGVEPSHSTKSEYITEDQKNAFLLDLCANVMLSNASTKEYEDVIKSVHDLTYSDAMLLYADLQEAFKGQNFVNLETFKNQAKEKIKDIGVRYVKTADSGESNNVESNKTYTKQQIDSFCNGVRSLLVQKGYSNLKTIDNNDGTYSFEVYKNGSECGTFNIDKNGELYFGDTDFNQSIIGEIENYKRRLLDM